MSFMKWLFGETIVDYAVGDSTLTRDGYVMILVEKGNETATVEVPFLSALGIDKTVHIPLNTVVYSLNGKDIVNGLFLRDSKAHKKAICLQEFSDVDDIADILYGGKPVEGFFWSWPPNIKN